MITLPEDALLFENPSFNAAIIGITTEDRVVYDYNKMVSEFMEEHNLSYDDAVDFIDHNTLNSLGYYDNSPVVMIPNEE